jgi:Glycosyl hydrolases family 16
VFRASPRRVRPAVLGGAAAILVLLAVLAVVLPLDRRLHVVPGSTVPSLDLPGWDLVLAEDFDTDARLGEFAEVYPGWAGYDGFRDTSRDLGRNELHQGVYDSSTTTTVEDGVVDVRVHSEGSNPQVMALTPTPDGEQWDGQLYGRYSVRFRADEVPGYKVAWLLWPASDDWTEGEIDFPEGRLGGEIMANSHDTTGDWHTATIEWEPGRVTFILDDRSWSTTDPAAIPTDPMRWVLQIETELTSEGPPDDAEGHVLIDWVAVWRQA